MDAKSRPAVVIDGGTGYTKLGFAGNVQVSREGIDGLWMLVAVPHI